MGAFKSILGRQLGIGLKGNIQGKSGDIPITQPCVDATITVAAEITDVRQISIQLRDITGAPIDYAETVEIVLLLNAAGTDFVATGGSTGLAIGAAGKLQALVAKKTFKAISSIAGVIALTWTDTGTEAAFLGLMLPNGRRVISAALTNA